MIEGNAGRRPSTPAQVPRVLCSDIKFSLIHAGGDKPPGRGARRRGHVRLNEARVQQLAATSGGDTSRANELGEVHADNRGGYQTFAGSYMGALFNESKRLGESLDGEKLTGSPGNGVRLDPARQAGHA